MIYIPDLPKSASLPVATVQQTKARLLDGRWDFDFVFFTESDQLLMLRPDAGAASAIFAHLHAHPRHVVLPHRLAPYPEDVLYVHARLPADHHAMEWTEMRCCLPRQTCTERTSWISVRNASVPLVRVFGLQLALGNINFHEEKLRACHLHIPSDLSLFC